MLVLLDESVPRQIAAAIDGYEVRTVARMGWSSTENGELLRLASAAGFGALITADRNIEYQQNVGRVGLGVVVLIAPSNSPERLLPLVPSIVKALDSLQPGQVVRIDSGRGTGRNLRSRSS